MSQFEWQECQALTILLKKTDDELKQLTEKTKALESRRQLIKRNLTEKVSQTF
jgi:hypothetical protein